MSVFGGIVLFIAGIVTGAGAVVFNRVCVRKESELLRRENDRLKNCAWCDRLEFETYKAYGDGYYDGSRSPMSDVEKFADFLERRRVQYRFPTEETDNVRAQRKSSRRA